MRWTAGIFACGMVACGGDPVGTWQGDCAVSTVGFEATYGFTLDITEIDGRDVRGTAGIEDEWGVTEAVLVGERRGRRLALDLEIELPDEVDDEYQISFGVDARVRGDRMVGECAARAGGFVIRNDIELERV